MKKKIISLFVLLILSVTCFAFGITGCGKGSSSNPHIVIRTDETELVVAVGENYTTPIAGVFDDNADRVDGKTIITSVYNPSNQLLEASSEPIHFRFMSRGVWRIVYTAYVDEQIDESVQEATITVYACSVLTTPKNLKVENNTLTWDSVTNASGYEVSVNGGAPVSLTTESFTNDIFGSNGYYVSVTAKGDNRNCYFDSKAGTYRNRTPLKEGELMAFNDPNAVFDITESVAANITLPPDEIEWLSEEECPGSTGGALKFRIKSGDWGWGVFKLWTMDGVALDSNDDWTGLEIRFKIDSKDYQPGTSRFTLSSAVDQSNQISRGMYVTEDNNDQWLVIQLEKKFLLAEGYKKYKTIGSTTASLAENVVTWEKNDSAYGYQVTVIKTDSEGAVTKKTYKDYSSENGFVVDDTTSFSFDISSDDTFYQAEGCTYEVVVDCEIPTTYNYVNFNMYNLVRTTGKGDIYIDYVRLYKDKFDAPENFRYENGKILWDTVEGAQFYTLNIITPDENGEDSTLYTVSGDKGEFDLSSIGLDPATVKFRAEIRATASDATKATSEWTKFNAVLAPTGLSISDDGILSWTAVENASGYVVSINGKEYSTNETSYDLTSFIAEGDVVTYVKALAMAGYLDGEFSAPCGKVQLTGNQMATFNSAVYEEMVATLSKGQQSSVGSSRVASVTYLDETACAGSNGGAVDIVLKWNNGDRKADFKVTFANKIDATNYDGIEVRFKVYDTSLWSNIENTPMYFKMINASGSVYGSATQSSYPAFIKTVTAVGEWLTVRFDSTTVAKCIVDDGYALSFQLIVHNPNTPEINGTGGIYLDDISYYKQLETPTNLSFNGATKTVSWDSVANATSYVVKIGETEIPVNTNSIDISAYSNSDINVYVKAVADGYSASEYAVKSVFALSANQIASFNSTAYEGTVATLPNGQQGSVGANKVTSASYVDETTCAGSNGGALDIVIKPTASGRQADFKVTFANPVDVTGYDGIEIRFKVYDTSFWKGTDATSKLYFKVINTSGSQYTTYDARFASEVTVVGEWVTVRFTAENIAKCYVDNGYALAFQLIMSGTHTTDLNGSCGIYLDDISYYKD